MWTTALGLLGVTSAAFLGGLGLRSLYDRHRDFGTTADRLLGYPRFASAAPRLASEPDLRPLTLYAEVLKTLKLYYVDELPSDTDLAHGSVDAMLSQLGDPNSRLVSPVEAAALRSAAGGEYRGLGAVLTIRRHRSRADREVDAVGAVEGEKPATGSDGIRTLTVVSVVPGGPAAAAGLRAGDRIVEMDGRWIAPTHVSFRLLTQLSEPMEPGDGVPELDPELRRQLPGARERSELRREGESMQKRWRTATDLPTALQILHSDSARRVVLTVERGSERLQIPVELKKTVVTPVAGAMRSADTAVLRIQSFDRGVPAGIRRELVRLQEVGAKRLVVDLRDSPGGDLDAAREAAGVLLGSARIGLVKERDAGSGAVISRPLTTGETVAPLKFIAITVLVNHGTAGASELLAAALRDVLGAPLVGEVTFGDGSVHTLYPLESGAAVCLTRARMLTARGVEFEGRGLKPDLIEKAPTLDSADRGFNLRPGVPAR